MAFWGGRRVAASTTVSFSTCYLSTPALQYLLPSTQHAIIINMVRIIHHIITYLCIIIIIILFYHHVGSSAYFTSPGRRLAAEI